MSDPLVVDLFVEDRAHEVFVGALANRVAREEQVTLSVQSRSARGGHPRALKEFGTYQALVEKGALANHAPDLVIVGRDEPVPCRQERCVAEGLYCRSSKQLSSNSAVSGVGARPSGWKMS